MFVILWDTESFMGWVVCGEKSIEYAVESAIANEADVTNLDGRRLSRVRLPQGVAESRMRNRQLIAKSIMVWHRGLSRVNEK